ncbi:MAG TPA: lycopene cyclase domain-containing protein [Ktedonobacterales bacterium]|nr:lycopene cyclase domain-containing protein [Ktedonobacterales bacterium]
MSATMAMTFMKITYGQFLLLCLCMPIAGLALLLLRDQLKKPTHERLKTHWRGRTPWVMLAVLIVVAMVYTAPWDNHLIAQGVWWYDPALVSGVTLGRIPVEELLFFPLQTILIGLWILWLIPRVPSSPLGAAGAGQERTSTGEESNVRKVDKATRVYKQIVLTTRVRLAEASTIRWFAAIVSASAMLWLVGFVILLRGWRPGTYLGWELVWALPPLLLQLGLGGDLLWRRRRLILIAFVPAVLYLSTADALAIHEGIWTISPHLSLGLLLGGVLPLEEFFFFLLTSALVTGGLVLGEAVEPRVDSRLHTLRQTRAMRL